MIRKNGTERPGTPCRGNKELQTWEKMKVYQETRKSSK